MQNRHRLLIPTGLASLFLMVAATAWACTFLVGPTEVVPNDTDTSSFTAFGEIAAAPADAVAADYYGWTYSGDLVDGEHPDHPLNCHGDQNQPGDDFAATTVEEEPGVAKVVSGTDTVAGTGKVLVCFASGSPDGPHGDEFGGDGDPKYSTTWAPFVVVE